MANITTVFEAATYRCAHHMGSGQQFPSVARATDRETGHAVEISSEQYPGLSRHQMIEKAVAILRNRSRGKFGAA